MALFRRKTETQTFWRVGPQAGDPDTLYQRGIMAVSSGDGPLMMQVGWNLWRSGGMEQRQAKDFLMDGFSSWSSQPDVGYEQTQLFLRDLFEQLGSSVHPPYSDANLVRVWSGTELYVRADRQADQETLELYRPRVFEALTSGPSDCLPARSYQLVAPLATLLGRPNPFA